MSELFLSFLASYIAGKALDVTGKVSLHNLNNAIDNLKNAPDNEGWSSSSLNNEQKFLLEALKKINQPKWMGWWAKISSKTTRPIVLIGPSGSGKSRIAIMLSGGNPNSQIEQSSEAEKETILSHSKYNPIVVAPGHLSHGVTGLAEIKSIFHSNDTPKVVCIVVCDGFHATESGTLSNSFIRPGSLGLPVADNLDDFRNKCRSEEIECLDWYLSACNSKNRIPSIVTIVNKRDLWSSPQSHVVPSRYTEQTTDYIKSINKLCEKWGFGQQSTHDVIPFYCHGGGFLPQENIFSMALSIKTAQVDAMILKALLYYRYTEGTLTNG
jgi:energy-coupling factor transporter ATP-binding protein EcfA2